MIHDRNQQRKLDPNMGSLEEEKLLQMVHDFIESESTSSSLSSTYYNSSTSTKNHAHFRHSSKYATLHEALRNKTEEETKIEEQVRKHMRNKKETEKTSDLKKWVVKCLKLDGFRASLSHISWVTTPSCPCGRYEYIEIVEEDGKGEIVRVIVDIDFKSQFEVARPTQRYKELVSKLPSIFVGKEAQLRSIITLLCSASEESLREQGLHIPPWRRSTYMHSKWNLSNLNNHNTNNSSNNNNNYYNNNKFNGYNCHNHVYIANNNNMVNLPSRQEKWVLPNEMRRRVELSGGGSRLSNQFSKMSVNCC